MHTIQYVHRISIYVRTKSIILNTGLAATLALSTFSNSIPADTIVLIAANAHNPPCVVHILMHDN